VELALTRILGDEPIEELLDIVTDAGSGELEGEGHELLLGWAPWGQVE
jgi:hypothetical protein